MDKQLVQGTLELIILDVLADGPSYGYLIAQTVLGRSKGSFQVSEGSLYPALHRMARQKLLSSYWDRSGEGRRRKYYKLTAQGRKVLASKKNEWKSFSGMINHILGASFGVG